MRLTLEHHDQAMQCIVTVSLSSLPEMEYYVLNHKFLIKLAYILEELMSAAE